MLIVKVTRFASVLHRLFNLAYEILNMGPREMSINFLKSFNVMICSFSAIAVQWSFKANIKSDDLDPDQLLRKQKQTSVNFFFPVIDLQIFQRKSFLSKHCSISKRYYVYLKRVNEIIRKEHLPAIALLNYNVIDFFL